MNQIFHPSMNTIARVSIIGGLLLVAVLAGGWYFFVRSPFMTNVGVAAEQPIPFSHEHHVSELGIDCRYCHTSVEEAAYAGLPPTHTCMTCHSQLFTDSEMLEPVRVSYATGMPIKWTRLHDLSDFVYFNHSIHVNKGIACETCHGRVDQMPLTYKAETLFMEWCLECHRAPEEFVRPQEEVYSFGWDSTADSEDELAEAHAEISGADLVEKYNIETGRLDNCSICHR